MQKKKKNKEKGQTVVGRVLRGGSWNNQSDNLRCAARNNDNPRNNWNNNGFRVVCVPPIIPTGLRTVAPCPLRRHPRDPDLMPAFQGTPDRRPGMTYDPFSCGHASPGCTGRGQPEYKFQRVALVSLLVQITTLNEPLALFSRIR
ncbi:MAG: hypothetical protein QG657_4248 [Acidobacteriota bacterium]|nr:hypothetical protein [Acidobacteriota bacterium]